jgi:hypothetical protein
MKIRKALQVLTNEDPRYVKKIKEAMETLNKTLAKHKKEWVGLTEDEFEKILEIHNEATPFAVYLSIEAKLKEKNV